MQKQRIYRIDNERDYGLLESLVRRKDRKINVGIIAEQWDRIAHFYSSLESGHATASIALRRLAAFSQKNRFYRANRELVVVPKMSLVGYVLALRVVRASEDCDDVWLPTRLMLDNLAF